MYKLKQFRVRWDIDAYFVFRSDLPTHLAEPDHGRFTIRELEGPQDKVIGSACNLFAAATEEEGKTEKSRNHLVDEVDARLRSGDRCFVAKLGDRVVGARWIAGAGSRVYEGFGAFVRDVPNSRLFNQAYVCREFRGYGLQRLMDASMKCRLASEGVGVTFVFVGVHNLASILNCHRCNDRYRLLYHVQVDVPGFDRRHFFPKSDREHWRRCVSG